MTTVFFDSAMPDDDRRARLYAGDLFVHSPVPAALELVALARELLHEGFGGKDPELAQYEYPVEEYAAILTRVKPKFIENPRCLKIIPAMLEQLGCDPELTYFDIPRMRSSTSDGYLTSGIAYAFHPHRDTWYSAPMCQLNWWLPIFELGPDNGLAFHPRYFHDPIENNSEIFDYQEWNSKHRYTAPTHVKRDTRPQPMAQVPVQWDPCIVPVPRVGGTTVFSAAHLHSSIPNRSGRTRFSIDFRTVHRLDAERPTGAPNVDSYCTGSTMNDYRRCTDTERLPASIQAMYAQGSPLRAPPRAARAGEPATA